MSDPASDSVAVIVVGGGPAGASAAVTLARLGVDTLLLERSDGGGNPDGECLAPTANALLHRLGLYDALLTSQPLPSYGTRSAWGGDGAPTCHDFLRQPHGHGWHLDRPAFNAALLSAVITAGASVHRRSRVVKIERAENGWHVLAETPVGTAELAADYVIDASGRSAILARRLGLRRHRFDSLVAAIAVLVTDDGGASDATTLVEATACGWWYAALLPDSRLVVTYFSDPDLLAQAALWRPAHWWHQLRGSQLIWDLVTTHGYVQPANIRLRPAASTLLHSPCGERWIATGDAAASFDPLSSHGIASALANGNYAGLAIAAALAGDESSFSTYTDRLRADYAHYLWLHQAYYRDEHRWLDLPFWTRRHGSESHPRRRCRTAFTTDARGRFARLCGPA